MSKKMENVRVVTFEENYYSKSRIKKTVDEKGKETIEYLEPVYKKGSVHAIHQKTVAQLKDKGAKMSVTKFDEQRAIQLAKKAMENDQKGSKARDN